MITDRIKDAIARCIATEKAYDVEGKCEKLGMIINPNDDPFRSKFKYVKSILTSYNKTELDSLGRLVNAEYNDIELSKVLDKLTNGNYYELSIITRRSVIEIIKDLKKIEGSLSANEFIELAELEYIRPRVKFNFWEDKPIEEDTIRSMINGPQVQYLSNDHFERLLTTVVSPLVRSNIESKNLVLKINQVIQIDGKRLVQSKAISDQVTYTLNNLSGVEGRLVNLIFASNGPKPKIVIEDAINNKIRITENEKSCLIYDRPITGNGFLWKDLRSWYTDQHLVEELDDIDNQIYLRLLSSLDSKIEVNFFKKYYSKYASDLEEELPVLIPQVYLHYDPYSQSTRQINELARQRMDFLILFSNHQRVVIEIDGKQHYSEGNISSPKLYSEMVSEDRRIKFQGYEIFRIGGYELTYNLDEVTEQFFENLMRKYLCR